MLNELLRQEKLSD
jgi:hypothetical protein